MANENQNTGPNRPPSTDQTRQTIADINQAKKSGGDFNDILKDSVNQLKKISNLYDDIEARLKSMSTSSINVKEINTQLFKAKEKDAVTSKKLQDAESKLGKDSENRMKQYLSSQTKISELEQRRLSYERQGLTEKVKEVDYILANQIARNERQKEGLSITELEVISLRESEKYTKSLIQLAQQKLQQEKEVRKEIGLSGTAMGLFANKLGLGNEIYEEMVEKAKSLKDQGKKMSFGDKAGMLAKGAGSAVKTAFTDPMGQIGLAVGAYKLVEGGLTAVGGAARKAGGMLKGLSKDSGTIVSDLASNISGLVENIPLVGGLLSGLIDGMASFLDLIVGVDDAIVKMGRQLNMAPNAARALNHEYQDIAFNSGNIFITSKKLLETQVRLSDQLGVTNLLSTERLETMVQLNDIAGLDAESQKAIAESSIITGESAKDTVKSVFAQVQGLKQATGIEFKNQQILKETANLSGYLGLSFSKYPAQLTKSLITVKAMGLELKQVDAMADSFLDFESSISKEFEAQLLTGKDINLTKAREAFLNNDLATAAQEITTQVGDSNSFLKLNRIQAESLASAFGMSRDQMGDMLKKQELLSKLGAKDTDNAQEQLRIGLERYGTQKALSAALGEDAYNSLVTASTQEKMAAYIEKIKQSIVDFIEKSGFIEKVEKFMNYISNPENLQGFLGMIRDTISSFIKATGEILGDILHAAGKLEEFVKHPISGTVGSMFGFEPTEELKKWDARAEAVRNSAASMASAVSSVGANKAKNEAYNSNVKESDEEKKKAVKQDDMSMARSVTVNAYLVDSQKNMQTRADTPPSPERHTSPHK